LIDLVIDQIHDSSLFEENKARLTWRKVSAYLCDHITDNIGREQVARYFKLHPSYVSRLFKQFSGMTFQRYFDKMRMQLAEEFLNHPDLAIEQIAQKCGYNSSSYFIRIFRKYYHTSPDKYRQSTLSKF
jgi:two-component system response regulator YesN